LQDPPKCTQNGDFWSENKPSGNPVKERAVVEKWRGSSFSFGFILFYKTTQLSLGFEFSFAIL
jgi:hypothetical protein